MRKFKGQRKLEDLFKLAKKEGWKIDKKDFDSGGDWILFYDFNNRVLKVLYNTFNGRFYASDPIDNKLLATETSTEFENEYWYIELLDMFYI